MMLKKEDQSMDASVLLEGLTKYSQEEIWNSNSRKGHPEIASLGDQSHIGIKSRWY